MDAKSCGLSKGKLLTQVKHETKGESFRKRTLEQVASRVFDSLEKRNWHDKSGAKAKYSARNLQ